MLSAELVRRIRESTGLTRKSFCEKYGIPYMTMTDWELGKHEIPPYMLRMLEYRVRVDTDLSKDMFSDRSVCHEWEKQKEYRTEFPVVAMHHIVPVKNIYPTKQQMAIDIHNSLTNDSRVVSAVLFGSSVTMKCRPESDLDIAVRLGEDYIDKGTKNEISEKIQEIADWNADIVWYDKIKPTDLIYRNIMKGVQVV